MNELSWNDMDVVDPLLMALLSFAVVMHQSSDARKDRGILINLDGLGSEFLSRAW